MKIEKVYRTIRKRLKTLNRKEKVAIFTRLSLSFLFILLFFFLNLLISVEESIPFPGEIRNRIEKSVIIYDREGEEIYRVFDNENREYVYLEDVSDYLKWSIIVGEDKNFYKHPGFDFKALVRCTGNSVLYKISGGRAGLICGASTLTQQLVRNSILEDDIPSNFYSNTLYRKIVELYVSYRIESSYTKDEILELYLNEIPFGGLYYGVQVTSKSLFDKEVKDLNLSEAAILAGLIQKPSSYNPRYTNDFTASNERKEYILDQLENNVEKLPFSKEDIEMVRDIQPEYSFKREDFLAPHFVYYMLDSNSELLSEYENKGLRIYTTLDLDLQKVAEEEISNGISKFREDYRVHNAALLGVDPNTFQILAMVGSVGFWESSNQVMGSYNRVLSRTNMASSVKPYTYIAAIEGGYGPWMETPDLQSLAINYGTINADGKSRGLITARKALVESLNIPAVYTLELVGIESFVKVLERAGISVGEDFSEFGYLSTLGPFDMSLKENVFGYALFANEGVGFEESSILYIKDHNDNLLWDGRKKEAERVFDEKSIYQLNYMLCDLGGHGDTAFSGYPYGYYTVGDSSFLCGKTGTSGGPEDLVSIQYNKNLVLGLWAGNDNKDPMYGGWSYNVSLPLTHRVFERVIDSYPSEDFDRPEDVLEGFVCTDTGMLRGEWPCPAEKTVYTKDSNVKVDSREEVYLCSDGSLASEESIDWARNHAAMYMLRSVLLSVKSLELGKYQDMYNEEFKNFHKASSFTDAIFSRPVVRNCGLVDTEQNVYTERGVAVLCYDGTQISINNSCLDLIEPSDGSRMADGLSATVRFEVHGLGNFTLANVYLDNVLKGSFNLQYRESDTYDEEGILKASFSNSNMWEYLPPGDYVVRVDVVDPSSGRYVRKESRYTVFVY